jgi:hypothetical protein
MSIVLSMHLSVFALYIQNTQIKTYLGCLVIRLQRDLLIATIVASLKGFRLRNEVATSAAYSKGNLHRDIGSQSALLLGNNCIISLFYTNR